MFEIEYNRKGSPMDDTESRIIDDETPGMRRADRIKINPESIGNGGLDRDRDAFTAEEIAIAEKIGLE